MKAQPQALQQTWMGQWKQAKGGEGSAASDHLVELFATPAKVSNAETAFHCKAADVALKKSLQQFIIHGPDQVS